MASKKASIKLLDLYTTFLAIAELEKNNPVLPFKLAWLIADIKAGFLKHAQRLEQEREKIFSTHGEAEPDKGPGNWKIKKEDVEEVNKQMQELNDTLIEVEFSPIPVTLLESLPNLQLSTGVFESLRQNVLEFPLTEENKT